jgi:signal peptidase I
VSGRAPRTGHRVGRVLLSAGAALGALTLLLVLAGMVAGVQPLVFRSGSMGPEIPAGSLALARTVPAAELDVGDVVSVVGSDGTRVTHRIVAIDEATDPDDPAAPADGGAVLTLRGDANPAADAETYPVTEADRVLWSAPGAGHVVAFLGGPVGLVLVGAAAMGLVVFALRPTPAGDRRRRARSATIAAPAVAVVLLGHSAVATTAAWTDPATVTSSALTAHTVVSQAQPTCTNQGGVAGLLGYARLTWAHVDARYDYAYTVVRVSDGNVRASGVISPSGAAGTTVTLDITSALVNLQGANRNFDVTIRSRLRGVPGWVAGTATTTRVHSVNIALLGLSMRCGGV